MKQKLNSILTFMLLFASITVMAQRPSMDEIKNKLRTDKVAYLTARIVLTPAEAEKFWPVYNEFNNKRVDIQMARFNLENRVLMHKESLSNDEIVKSIKDYNQNKLQEEELNVKYYEQFLKILPPKKVLNLYQAEKDYINYLNLRNRGGVRNDFNR